MFFFVRTQSSFTVFVPHVNGMFSINIFRVYALGNIVDFTLFYYIALNWTVEFCHRFKQYILCATADQD